MVVCELDGGERTVLTLCFLKDRDVRLDAFLLYEPSQHLRRTLGFVRRQEFRVEAEPVPRAQDYLACRTDLSLPDRRGGFDIL